MKKEKEQTNNNKNEYNISYKFINPIKKDYSNLKLF